MTLPLLLLAAQLASHTRDGNRVSLKLPDGGVAIDWISDSSFRFSRTWGRIPAPSAGGRDPVVFDLADAPDALRLKSRYLAVTIAKSDARVRVLDGDGQTLLDDVSPVTRGDGALSWDRAAPAGARYFGLGVRGEGPLDLRGTAVTATVPFLLATTGYGERHVAPGTYTFDLAKSHEQRYHIEARGADRIEYEFFYGPAAKEVFEEFQKVRRPIGRLSPSRYRPLRSVEVPPETAMPEPVAKPSWQSLEATIRRWMHGALSGVLLPAFDQHAYDGAEPALAARAAQLGSVAPILVAGVAEPIRARLAAYFLAYGEEARDRGFPFLRPMPFQYSNDPRAALYPDQFMLGDELLVAPIYTPDDRRTVYFPMGLWTNLATNQTYRGRQVYVIEADAAQLPLFSRNGALLPLGSDPMELHYFPRLGAEFFLYESDLADYSQLHAGPAGDLMRLEIESRKERVYEWIVHHVDRPSAVSSLAEVWAEVSAHRALKPGAWFYDEARRNVHVRARVEQDEDRIIHLR